MGCCKCLCFLLIIAILIIAGSLGLFATFFPYPSHASCRVDWVFGETCSTVEDKLVAQMKEWSGDGNCDLKQQCLYEYLGQDGNVIRGKHTTNALRYVDSFNFTFMRGVSDGCHVVGASESDSWYATIDWGTNYCNLKNLIIGAELNLNDDMYSENSTNSVCTMYSVAHCSLY